MKYTGMAGLFFLLLAGAMPAFAQKIIAEGTIVYDLKIRSENNLIQKGEGWDKASNTVYLKGNNSRTDLVSPLGNESTIHDAKQGTAVILKEFSGQKLMIRLTRENWIAKNKRYSDMKFELKEETKTIAGYPCKLAIAQRADGKSFPVYYAPGLIVSNKDYNPSFANLPGLAMEYEIETKGIVFSFTISKINFDPVHMSIFDFPKSGYRVMTYEENLQLRKGKE